MKILLGCLNANGIAGSEMFHYELVRELHLMKQDVTLFTLRNVDPQDQVRIKLTEMGVKQVDLNSLNASEEFDIIIASQPQVNIFMLQNYKNTPIISIIHSEIRSEDPILDSRISHYIGIRQPIVDMLINDYKIDPSKVSLTYNPIDQSRFNSDDASKLSKTTGIFVGEVLDNIRFQAVSHLVNQCIENDWNLLIMSDSRYDFNHPNISYVDRRWDTESIVKNVDFTGGILLGRTTLEGWSCDVPGYMYIIDIHGNVIDIQSDPPENVKQLCDSKFVAKEYIKLCKKIKHETVN
jgi:hypothetical protein